MKNKIEPIAGSTGTLVPPKGYLQRLREICDKHGILLIFDEVITGWGRTGSAFASHEFGVTPDIMTMAKATTNGVVPMGVVACLMGPLTGYRIWFADEYQQRANAWMLMILSMGFVFSTLPVQILLPVIGWRWIFGSVAIVIFLIIILTLLFIPSWKKEDNKNEESAGSLSDRKSVV